MSNTITKFIDFPIHIGGVAAARMLVSVAYENDAEIITHTATIQLLLAQVGFSPIKVLGMIEEWTLLAAYGKTTVEAEIDNIIDSFETAEVEDFQDGIKYTIDRWTITHLFDKMLEWHAEVFPSI